MFKLASVTALVAASLSAPVYADTCGQMRLQNLKATLSGVVPSSAGAPNGGLGFPMWLTVVDGSGIVCSVTTSLQGGSVTSDIWLGSRVISAQKANTANAFSTGALALSTANLYAAVQPGGSLFGLQESNPVDATIAYDGDASDFGTGRDPLVGKRIGGINVFGGGLALYKNGKKIGAIGVSGDTSCTDHVVAWKVRAALGLGAVPVFANFDKMFQDLSTANPSGFGHPTCLNNPTGGQNGNDGGSIIH